MAVINRVPKGLLSLLDAKTLGRTPANVEPEVSVGIDATPMYFADIPLEVEFDIATGITALGVPVSVTIPAGQTWLVYELSLRCTNLVVGATDVCFAPAYSIAGNAADRIHDDSLQQQLPGVTDQATKTMRWPEGRLFSFGTILEGVHLQIVGGAGVRYDFAVSFRRLTT